MLTSMADYFCDRSQTSRLEEAADIPQVEAFIDAAERLGTTIRESHSSDSIEWSLVRDLIHRIEVGAQNVSLILNPKALAHHLAMVTPGSVPPEIEDSIRIVVPARLQRCGKQVRLVLGEVESNVRKADPGLVRLVRDARRWFDDLRTGRASTIAAITKRDHQQVSEISRSVSLAFLAPDITRMILEGSQPIALTLDRLKAARPLALDWNEQREVLLG